MGAGGSIVVKALCYKPESSGFDTLWGEFLNLPILPAALGPGVYSASNRMSTRNIKIIMFLGNTAHPARKTDKLTTICEPIVQTMWDP
jgi:hypothetical protein